MVRESGLDVRALIAQALRDAPGATTVATRRALAKGLARELRSAPDRVSADAALALARGGERFVAYELVDARRACAAHFTAAEIEELGEGCAAWNEVDCFACFVAGPAWRSGAISDARVASWTRSKDRWIRRRALVATVPLNSKARGGSGDPERTFAIAELLLNDRDDMVVKALSWALRELIPYDPDALERFLARHRERIAARVQREVGNKLDTGLKNPRKRATRAR